MGSNYNNNNSSSSSSSSSSSNSSNSSNNSNNSNNSSNSSNSSSSRSSSNNSSRVFLICLVLRLNFTSPPNLILPAPLLHPSAPVDTAASHPATSGACSALSSSADSLKQQKPFRPGFRRIGDDTPHRRNSLCRNQERGCRRSRRDGGQQQQGR